jgi:hypothetical protein
MQNSKFQNVRTEWMGMRYQTKDFASLFSNYYKHRTSMAESTKVALRGASEYLWKYGKS